MTTHAFLLLRLTSPKMWPLVIPGLSPSLIPAQTRFNLSTLLEPPGLTLEPARWLIGQPTICEQLTLARPQIYVHNYILLMVFLPGLQQYACIPEKICMNVAAARVHLCFLVSCHAGSAIRLESVVADSESRKHWLGAHTQHQLFEEGQTVHSMQSGFAYVPPTVSLGQDNTFATSATAAELSSCSSETMASDRKDTID